jgi:hypothetical protein
MECFFWHNTGQAVIWEPIGIYKTPDNKLAFYQADDHIESPESKRRFENLLKVTGLLNFLIKLDPL